MEPCQERGGSMEADPRRCENSGSMSPEERNWWTGHLHAIGQVQYDQPNITTMSAFRDHLRLAPTEEMVPLAVTWQVWHRSHKFEQWDTEWDRNLLDGIVGFGDKSQHLRFNVNVHCEIILFGMLIRVRQSSASKFLIICLIWIWCFIRSVDSGAAMVRSKISNILNLRFLF